MVLVQDYTAALGRGIHKKVTAMNDSFTVRVWGNPLPHHRRVPDFPHSAPCFASFMLDNDAAWQTEFA